MGAMTVYERAPSEPLTYGYLERMPDDGRRYELIDGVLIVTPSPTTRHQWVVSELFKALDRGCPPDINVLFAPLDVRLTDDTVLEP